MKPMLISPIDFQSMIVPNYFTFRLIYYKSSACKCQDPDANSGEMVFDNPRITKESNSF